MEARDLGEYARLMQKCWYLVIGKLGLTEGIVLITLLIAFLAPMSPFLTVLRFLSVIYASYELSSALREADSSPTLKHQSNSVSFTTMFCSSTVMLFN